MLICVFAGHAGHTVDLSFCGSNENSEDCVYPYQTPPSPVPFGFEGRMWDLIVSVSDNCLSFYFTLFDDVLFHRTLKMPFYMYLFFVVTVFRSYLLLKLNFSLLPPCKSNETLFIDASLSEERLFEGLNRPFLAVIHKQTLLPWVFRRVLNRLSGHVLQTRAYVTAS